MNRLQILVAPAPDAVETAADLILMLMLHRETLRRLVSLCVRTDPKTQQIEIIAEYSKISPSAPLLHPLKAAKNSKLSVCTSPHKNRRCTISARHERKN